MTPMNAAIRDGKRAVVRFSCSVRSNHATNAVFVWATYGQRKRLPARTEIEHDDCGEGGARHLVIAVAIPSDYRACTLHVCIRDGLRFKFFSRRVEEEEFVPLAPVLGSAQADPRYHDWFLAHRATSDELQRQRVDAARFDFQPLVSIVTPVFRTPAEYLRECIASILGQTYGRLELVIVNASGVCPEVDAVLAEFDDERLRVLNVENRTIPENTNVGIAAARGDYIAFVDHDDFIEPDALYSYVEAINAHPHCDLLFCDEDLWVEEDGRGCFTGVRFKPGWDPDLVYSHNYVCHMLMVSRAVLDRTQRTGAEMNGAQDYDLTLKAAEIAADICRVPRVLYHWRDHIKSTARHRESKPYALEAGRKAVQAHFDRIGVSADVVIGATPMSYHVCYPPVLAEDVSIVLLEDGEGGRCPEASFAGALGGEVEIIAGNRADPNAAIGAATRSLVVVLDRSAQVCGEVWLDVLVRQLHDPEIGCSAPVLVDDRGVVLSAGMVLSADGSWLHALRGYPVDDYGYMTLLAHPHGTLAAPLCCVAFRKEDYERVGGFDRSLPDDLMAMDFCLKLREARLRTVVAPDSVVVSASGLPARLTPEQSSRLAGKHPLLANGDPFFNPQLDQASGSYLLF